MNLLDQILSSEDYIDVSPEIKTSLEYKIAYLVKEEIRQFKWYCGEAGKNLNWQQAIDKLMENTSVSVIDVWDADFKEIKNDN